MSIPITTILAALGQSGFGDIISSMVQKGDNADKLKLKLIGILVDNMDENGACKVKDVIKELVDVDDKFFEFGGDD